jgi:hypothetical protein
MADESHIVANCHERVVGSEGKPEGELTPGKEKAYSEANTIFCGAVVGVLIETLQDMYLCYKIAKEMWDALNTEYGGSDAGTELYIIEQYQDYHMPISPRARAFGAVSSTF